MNPRSHGWMSLSNIVFAPDSLGHISLPLAGSWVAYGGNYGSPDYTAPELNKLPRCPYGNPKVHCKWRRAKEIGQCLKGEAEQEAVCPSLCMFKRGLGPQALRRPMALPTTCSCSPEASEKLPPCVAIFYANNISSDSLPWKKGIMKEPPTIYWGGK